MLVNLWLCCFLEVPNLVLREVVGEGVAQQYWLYPIASVPGSCGLAWKMRLAHGGGNTAGDLLVPECERGGCVDLSTAG